MLKPLLPVPHRTEAFTGGCLPACCEMALAYCGILETQATIASQIGHVAGAGTPARNIVRLATFGVKVLWHESGNIEDLRQVLVDHAIPVVFLRTGELPYWDCDTPHVVIVVGIAAETVYVNDPAFPQAPISVPLGDFQLAWDEFAGQWATVQCCQ
ncbi:MAG: C39 family peptidase [Anaerolineae bacterium]